MVNTPTPYWHLVTNISGEATWEFEQAAANLGSQLVQPADPDLIWIDEEPDFDDWHEPEEEEMEIDTEKSLSSPDDLLKGKETRYDTAGDAHMRLAGTLVRFNNQPVLIKKVVDLNCLAWDLRPGSKNIMFHANDKRLDISSIPLGFVNADGNGFYVVRNPARSQRQGVALENCPAFDLTSGRSTVLTNSTQVLLGVSDLLNGIFPTLEEAASRPSSGFSRTWGSKKLKDPALRLIFHRNIPVALFVQDESRFIFTKGALTRPRYNGLMNVLSKKGAQGVYYHVEEAS